MEPAPGDLVMSPSPPEMTRRTGCPVAGCDANGASLKLCFTSNRWTSSSGATGMVS
jgi:hypothetical protein